MRQHVLLILSIAALALMPPMPSRASPAVGTVGGSCLESDLDGALAGGGFINFACGGPKTIALTTVKTITQTTTIDGGDVITLTGGLATRLFVVNSGARLQLQHIVQDGAASTGSDGGAIVNHGLLSLDHTTIQNSQTDPAHSGGAIFSDGPLTITASTLKGNTGGSAGALFANFGQAIVTIDDSLFSGNKTYTSSAGFGGAIWAGSLARVAIKGGAILSNTGQLGGGLYLSANATVTVGAAGAPALLSGNRAVDGGGIDSQAGALTLDHATLSANHGLSNGGGLFVKGGALTMTDASLTGNTAGAAAGLFITGASALLENATLDANLANDYGGGIYASSATLSLRNVTLSGNRGGVSGGGLFALQAGLTVTDSTFSGNSAPHGGGVANLSSSLTVSNTTLSGNSASSDGGGVFNGHGNVALTNATLSGNSAPSGAGIYNDGLISETADLTSTLIVNSPVGGNCAVASSSVGVIHSHQYNLSSDGTCSLYFNQPEDLNDVSANLGPLADNGGPTLTLLPIAPSPAIDAIPLGANGCGATLNGDQRGAPRPIHGQCDIGAVEAGWAYLQLWLALVRR